MPKKKFKNSIYHIAYSERPISPSQQAIMVVIVNHNDIVIGDIGQPQYHMYLSSLSSTRFFCHFVNL